MGLTELGDEVELEYLCSDADVCQARDGLAQVVARERAIRVAHFDASHLRERGSATRGVAILPAAEGASVAEALLAPVALLEDRVIVAV